MISFVIILPLLIVPLFCCCNREAIAATVGVDHCQDGDGCDRSEKQDASNPRHTHSCDCGHAQNAIFDSVKISALHFSMCNLFSAVTATSPLSGILLKRSIYPANLGPPGALAVPLYIQLHALRI